MVALYRGPEFFPMASEWRRTGVNLLDSTSD
jgi:hypothetical protein